jgi:hypothetical protein
MGASDVINAQGQFLINKRQSDIVKEQAEQAKLDTKRKAIEQWQYEKSIEPTVSELKAKSVHENYMQMRGFASDGQIWSGEALNVILRNIQQGSSTRRPSIPLDPDVVSKINITDGTNSGNLGQFREGAKIDWPFSLRAPQFGKTRSKIEQLMGDALAQVKRGAVDFGTADDLQKTIDGMYGELKDDIENMTATDYTKSKRFLNDLGKSVRSLGHANASELVTGKWQPEAGTVDQLVASLTKRGLTFAPAREGNEAAYSSLYQSFRAYDTQSSQLVARPGGR